MEKQCVNKLCVQKKEAPQNQKEVNEVQNQNEVQNKNEVCILSVRAELESRNDIIPCERSNQNLK